MASSKTGTMARNTNGCKGTSIVDHMRTKMFSLKLIKYRMRMIIKIGVIAVSALTADGMIDADLIRASA